MVLVPVYSPLLPISGNPTLSHLSSSISVATIVTPTMFMPIVP